jgi:hypothetical protein
MVTRGSSGRGSSSGGLNLSAYPWAVMDRERAVLRVSLRKRVSLCLAEPEHVEHT